MNHETPLMAQALADVIGATKRQVQIWTDAGAIVCIPETDRQGRGRQRLYDPSEIPIAGLVAAISKYKLPIGMIVGWSQMVRTHLAGRGQGASGFSPYEREWYEAALAGELRSFLVLTPDEKQAFAWVNMAFMMILLNDELSVAVINVKAVIDRLDL